MVIAFKYLLACNDWNKTFQGGISSYCLFLMIAAYLEHYSWREPIPDEEGELFILLLKFFGEDFQN